MTFWAGFQTHSLLVACKIEATLWKQAAWAGCMSSSPPSPRVFGVNGRAHEQLVCSPRSVVLMCVNAGGVANGG